MDCGGVNFDLSGEAPNNFFKSSFARSMAFCNTQSKSLDYVYLDESSTITEESEAKKDLLKNISEAKIPSRKPRRSVPTLPTYDPAFPREYSASVRLSTTRANDAIKFWKMKQESALNPLKSPEAIWNNEDALQEESKEEEILRLRKECQGLMEANRKLQAGNPIVDPTLIQSQIDTLQWQLKQAESNRQMYRAVMEQVSKFLERVQKALENNPRGHPPRGKSRVPRSRSVHTVVTQSRASSPSSCHPVNVHRANSISQMQDSYSTLREYAWRSSRAGIEEISPERLSQDAFRLFRTIQSLLSTREPDLARVSDNSQRRDSTSVSMGSCSSLVQSSCGASQGEDTKSVGPATPQLSVGSTEDESGFSSMSSFHEGANGVNVTSITPVANGTEGSHHELGLPVVNEPNRHRRWSSTPVETGFRPPIRVLWTRNGTDAEVPNCAYLKTKTVNTTSYPNFRYNSYMHHKCN